MKFLQPVNDNCVDCNQRVYMYERQELAWDSLEHVRRRCGTCIQQAAHALRCRDKMHEEMRTPKEA